MSPSPRRRTRTWTSPAALLALACFLAVAAVAVYLVSTRPTSPERPRQPSASTPSRTVAPAAAGPSTMRTLAGDLRPGDPADVAWVEGSVLHVGTDSVSLAPHGVQSFVLARGAVYFLDQGRLWATDLVRVRDTGVGGTPAATDLVTDRSGRLVRVTIGGRQRAWDVTTGRPVPAGRVVPLTPRELLGAPVTVRVRGERSDVGPQAPAPGRAGPGPYAVLGSATDPLVAVRTATGQSLELRGVVGDGFELTRWTGPTTFHGLALSGGRPLAVLACDLAARSCRDLGRVSGQGSLLLDG